MGSLEFHHILMDIRHATLPPLPEALAVQVVTDLKRRGIGVANKVAVVVNPDDEARADRIKLFEAIATHMGVRLRCFVDYGDALDWISDPAK